MTQSTWEGMYHQLKENFRELYKWTKALKEENDKLRTQIQEQEDLLRGTIERG